MFNEQVSIGQDAIVMLDKDGRTVSMGAPATARGGQTATHGESRYNIAPSQEVPVFVTGTDGDGASVRLMRWGLVPSWARDTKIAYSTINARVETVAEKPAFRGAWRARGFDGGAAG